MARKYRFFTTGLNNVSDFTNEVTLSAAKENEILEQLARILRAKPGDNVVLIPPGQKTKYFEFHYEVLSAHKKGALLRLREKVANNNELKFKLGLILCMPNKPDKLSFILQKAVELGAYGITLVEGDFSQMKHAVKADRLRKIVKEAAEQSERAFIPDVNIFGKLTDYLSTGPGIRPLHNYIVAMERTGSAPLPELIKGLNGPLQVIIGPEGGFSGSEKEYFKKHGFKTYTLGDRILRMETAAVLRLGIISLYHRLPEAP